MHTNPLPNRPTLDELERASPMERKSVSTFADVELFRTANAFEGERLRYCWMNTPTRGKKGWNAMVKLAANES